jgi:hypothetical protein
VRVSEQSKGGGRAKGPPSETGVLANLPRTRPQRSSARRAAARTAASAPAQAQPAKAKRANAKAVAAKPAKAKATQAKPTQAKPTQAKPTKAKRTAGRTDREQTVPRQGFEVDGDLASGSVQPPGAAELVSAAAELAGELAKAGVSGSARLLKDLFGRLPPG